MNWTEVLKILGTIIVAAVTAFGGGYFSYRKFILERKDAKEEKSMKLLIEAEVSKAKDEMRKEIKDSVQKGIVDCGEIGNREIRRVQEEIMQSLKSGLAARGEEGKERFDINSRQIQANSKQLAENSKQIEEILGIVKGQAQKYDVMADSLTALNKVVSLSADSLCNSNFDRLLIVTNKVLKNGKLTISDKTNLKQLYSSWKELGGKDPKMDTMYEECMKMTLVTDNEA